MNLPIITPTQSKILIFIYRFRFLSRIHIQENLGHADPKRINVWLKDLVEKEYLGRIFKKELPGTVQPAVYFLEKNGIKYIRDSYKKAYYSDLRKRTREQEKSATFRSHCLEVANIYLECMSYAQEEDLQITFSTRTDFEKDDPVLPLFPDACITLENDQEKMCYFLEIIDSITPSYILKYRIREYIEYFNDATWQYHMDVPFPTCLFFCQNGSRQQAVKKVLAREFMNSDNPEIPLQVSTWKKIDKNGLNDILWRDTNIETEDDYIEEEMGSEEGY